MPKRSMANDKDAQRINYAAHPALTGLPGLVFTLRNDAIVSRSLEAACWIFFGNDFDDFLVADDRLYVARRMAALIKQAIKVANLRTDKPEGDSTYQKEFWKLVVRRLFDSSPHWPFTFNASFSRIGLVIRVIIEARRKFLATRILDTTYDAGHPFSDMLAAIDEWVEVLRTGVVPFDLSEAYKAAIVPVQTVAQGPTFTLALRPATHNPDGDITMTPAGHGPDAVDTADNVGDADATMNENQPIQQSKGKRKRSGEGDNTAHGKKRSANEDRESDVRLKEELREANDRIKDLNSEIDSLTKHNDRLIKKNNRLVDQIDDCDDECARLYDKNKDLEARIAVLEADRERDHQM